MQRRGPGLDGGFKRSTLEIDSNTNEHPKEGVLFKTNFSSSQFEQKHERQFGLEGIQ
jgi:hypothetical protein